MNGLLRSGSGAPGTATLGKRAKTRASPKCRFLPVQFRGTHGDTERLELGWETVWQVAGDYAAKAVPYSTPFSTSR